MNAAAAAAADTTEQHLRENDLLAYDDVVCATLALFRALGFRDEAEDSQE